MFGNSYFEIDEEVSIPNGKGKGKCKTPSRQNLYQYQFPMGKVKAMVSKAFKECFGQKYQFPMGKVKLIFYFRRKTI